MVKISISYFDDAMPRTVFYQRLLEAVQAHSGFTPEFAATDLLFPAEDTCIETNWPRYGTDTAFLRGCFDHRQHSRYLNRLALAEQPLCVVNMHPFIRVPLMMARNTNVVVADINLLRWERAANPRTISMPALPITEGSFDSSAKRILASFRGAESHPCRSALA